MATHESADSHTPFDRALILTIVVFAGAVYDGDWLAGQKEGQVCLYVCSIDRPV